MSNDNETDVHVDLLRLDSFYTRKIMAKVVQVVHAEKLLCKMIESYYHGLA